MIFSLVLCCGLGVYVRSIRTVVIAISLQEEELTLNEINSLCKYYPVKAVRNDSFLFCTELQFFAVLGGY